MDRGARWAAVHGVTQSQTRLKRLSTNMFHVSATVYFLVEILISSEVVEGQLRQREEEEKIRLKIKDFIIIVCSWIFSHCIFLELNELNVVGGREYQRFFFCLSWAKKYTYLNTDVRISSSGFQVLSLRS